MVYCVMLHYLKTFVDSTQALGFTITMIINYCKRELLGFYVVHVPEYPNLTVMINMDFTNAIDF